MTTPADYSVFQVDHTQYPLAVPGAGGNNSGGSAGGTSLLQIADPALFYLLDFFTFVVNQYCGAALVAAFAQAGREDIQSAVLQTYPYDPDPVFLETQVRLPALFVYRTRSRTEQWTAGWEHDVTDFAVAYVLPPLDAKGLELVLPILPAIAKALRKKLTDAWDPGYAPPGGNVGDQFDNAPYANLQEIGFGEWGNPKRPLSEWYRIGRLPKTDELWFPALMLSGYMVERDAYYPAPPPGPSKFAGGDVTGNLNADDGTVVAPFVQVSTQQAPTIGGVSPATGSHLGGTSVTITGTLFLSGPPAVYFGPADNPQYATSVTFGSSTSLTVTTPAMQDAGAVDVTVVNRDGQMAVVPSAFAFT